MRGDPAGRDEGPQNLEHSAHFVQGRLDQKALRNTGDPSKAKSPRGLCLQQQVLGCDIFCQEVVGTPEV